MGTTTNRPLSTPLVVITMITLLAGLGLGALTMGQATPVAEHHPEQNAIAPHLVIGFIVLTAAVAMTLFTRSLRWLWAPLSARTGRRISATFRKARGSFTGVLRCVIFVILATLMFYLVLRMGIQATAGLNPSFTVNAWGGPTRIGAFAAHGVDALLCIGISSLILNGVLNQPEDTSLPVNGQDLKDETI